MSADAEAARHLASLAAEIEPDPAAAAGLLLRASVMSMAGRVGHGERAIVFADYLDPVLSRFGLMVTSKVRR